MHIHVQDWYVKGGCKTWNWSHSSCEPPCRQMMGPKPDPRKSNNALIAEALSKPTHCFVKTKQTNLVVELGVFTGKNCVGGSLIL